MQTGGHAHAGDKANFILEPDKAERPIVIPAELEKLFKQEKVLRKFFNEWSDSGKRWVVNEIMGKKNAASRQKRVEQLAEQMLETIDAERELPPMIARAFAGSPQARAAWKKATPLYRRQRLYAVFYYRNVDSRERRVQKVIDELLAKADSSSSSGE